MKKFFYLFAILLAITVSSCGSSVKIDENLSKEETEAVVKTEASLPRGSKIISYEVVKSTLPLAMLDNEYKGFRDDVYKARLDYRTNTTRGLDAAVQKNLNTLKEIQDKIVKKELEISESSPQYIFVLALVEERQRSDGKPTSYIGVYDANTIEQVDLVQVTQPLFNNAVMVTEAIDGTLSNPMPTEPNALKSSNPVVSFILQANPK